MVFGWFDAKAAQAFGVQLAAEFKAKLPPDAALNDRKFEQRAKSAVAQMQRAAAEFRREHRLNVYQKAKLGNAFKWALREAGYEAGYVDKLTDLLMLQFG